MTSKEFVIWLKGFTEGVHEFAITPKQWDYLKEKLAEVNDGTPIGTGWGTPNTTPMWQHPHYVDPFNPYKVTCRGEETPTGTTITTTPATTGFITISNPNIASFGTGSTGTLNTYNPSTSTTYGYPSGSAWSYTTSNEKVF
ncbi:MAG: hypothetical protein EBS55_07540 [Flavobacteriaceae bacterium]|nr:hypothetical protein [Flavobacteriaceae bacterium]